MSDSRPIAVFDSGVGGLTVFRALRAALPSERLIYFGDTARLPYGSKTREAVTRFKAVSKVKNTEQGAATSVWCATSEQLAGMGGVYCEDVDIAQAVPADFTAAHGVRPWAIDSEQAERLWRISEEWTSVMVSD